MMLVSRSVFTIALLWGSLNLLGQTCAEHKRLTSSSFQTKADASRSDSIDILHTLIDLDLTPVDQGLINAKTTLRFAPRVSGISVLPLDLLALTVDSVTMNGGTLAFNQSGELFTINLGGTFDPADTLQLTVHYGGDPSIDGSGWGGFYTSGSIIYNLGVAFESQPHSYGRAWFPCFDNFVERSTLEFIVRTDLNRHAWCNGERLSETDLGGGLWESHWKMAGNIPSYLASVAASTYTAVNDTFPSAGGGVVPVHLVAQPGDTTDLKNSFTHLKEAFDAFETTFGPYRWERVGYCLTPQGAMEHPCNISYPASIVDGGLQFEATMAHELAHMWFGNLITCSQAEEMYINEGFAEYLSYLFLEAVYGNERYMDEVRNNHHDMLHTAHVTDEGWYALNAVPQDFTYGEHTYNKGADVLHTLRNYLGNALFSSGLTSVLNANAFNDISTAELRDQLTAATGVDLTDYFSDWIEQPGWAAFEVDGFSASPNGGGYAVTVQLQQKLRHADHFYNNVPVTVTCVGANGELYSELHALGGANPSVVLQSPFEPAIIWLNNDERISLAITAEQDTITAAGTNQYNLANFRVTANAVPDTAILRVEEYWVAADELTDEPFAYVVSPDRYWRISGLVPAGCDFSGRINYDGRPTAAGSYDVGLVQDFGGVAFREDSLVLLYRSAPGQPWTRVTTAIVNTQGSATDGAGRIDFDGLQLGEYTLAWRKSAVGIVSSESAGAPTWCVVHDAAHAMIIVESRAGAVPGGTVSLIDAQGRTVKDTAITGTRLEISAAGMAAGAFQVMYGTARTPPQCIGRVVLAGRGQ